MGDKGGKKDKEKGQKQDAEKQKQKSKLPPTLSGETQPTIRFFEQ